MSALPGPLDGVRVLCDLGADVVKFEPPEGDVTRKWGKVIAGLSGYYVQQNVGKRGVCLDLRKPEGPARDFGGCSRTRYAAW